MTPRKPIEEKRKGLTPRLKALWVLRNVEEEESDVRSNSSDGDDSTRKVMSLDDPMEQKMKTNHEQLIVYTSKQCVLQPLQSTPKFNIVEIRISHTITI